MARKRKYTASSSARHKLKMERIFSAGVSPETAREVASAVNSEWANAFGTIREAYRKMKEYLGKAHPEVPIGLYGLYRSFVLKAMKHIPTGASPDSLIDEFVKKCGLDAGVMSDLLQYFGLAIEKAQEETVTAK